MTRCTVKVCRNYKGRLKTTKEITYHRIPTDPIVRSQWVKILKTSRGDNLWEPSKSTVVCSDHFRSNEFVSNQKRHRLKKTAVPSKALFLSSLKSDSSDNDNSDETNTIKELKSPIVVRNEESEASDISRDIQPSISSTKTRDDVEYADPLSPGTGHIADSTAGLTEFKPEIIEDFSDIDSVYDSPHKAKLRKDLRSKIRIQKQHTLRIQSLRRKNIRLKKKVASLKKSLEIIKKERSINNKRKEHIKIQMISTGTQFPDPADVKLHVT